ncbi:MAG: TadE/TadG family type IV pilus assembly protein [Planctomycetia bacterium]|nr:TadE/TadG family type IV pilus assembly protein [Planctomycetia bacterium]
MKRRKTISRRRGALTMELILIFPVVMLLFILFYQVSVMLLTYHSLQTAVNHAAAAAADAEKISDISDVMKNAVRSWYYEPDEITPTTKADSWENAKKFSFRILVAPDPSNGQVQWAYAESDDDLTNAKIVAVEAKLPKLSRNYGNYWLLPQFKGVNALQDKKDRFVVSAAAYR